MKKNIIRAVCIGAFIVMFCVINQIWKFLLIDDTNSYTRVMMHELYDSENIDVIFVGSSHVYRSFVPDITDEEFGCYTFNAGSSSQQMDGSAAIIKEAIKNNDVKNVYLELYYAVAEEKYIDRSGMTATYIISDYMPISFEKISYLLKASSKEHWVNSFVIPRREWNKFFDSDYVMNLLIKKTGEDYRNYVLSHDEEAVEYYVERGFVANNATASYTTLNDKGYGNINIDCLKGSDWEKSIIDIVNYCKSNNVSITLFVSPEPEWTIVGKGNYQEYYNYIKELADNLSVDYYDFNLCKDQYLDRNDLELFKDTDHLNTRGAELFSHVFGELCVGKITERDVFYNSYEEMVQDREPMVYGVAGPRKDSEQGIKECYIISSREKEIEYRVFATTSEGVEYEVKPFDTMKNFTLPIDESGTIRIEWRTVSNLEDINFIEVAY